MIAKKVFGDDIAQSSRSLSALASERDHDTLVSKVLAWISMARICHLPLKLLVLKETSIDIYIGTPINA